MIMEKKILHFWKFLDREISSVFNIQCFSSRDIAFSWVEDQRTEYRYDVVVVSLPNKVLM